MMPPSVVFYVRILFYLARKIYDIFRGIAYSYTRWVNQPSAAPNTTSESRRVRRWPESIKIGSELFSSIWPRFQLVIWDKDGSTYKPIACAFRVSDYVITSSHCLVDPKTVALSTDVGDVCVLEYETIYNADELAIIKVHPTFFTENKVTCARLSSDIDGIARISGCDVRNSTSCGVLKPTSTFSLLSYSGTTKPGFSGSPYVVGDTKVVAMHICGGADGNLCIQGSYIKLVLSRFLDDAPTKQPKRKPYTIVQTTSTRVEEKKKGKSKRKTGKRKTTDWYSEEITESTRIKYRKSRYDPDEYEVSINGRYYNLDREQLQDLRAKARSQGATITPDFESHTKHRRERRSNSDTVYGTASHTHTSRDKSCQSSESDAEDSSTDDDSGGSDAPVEDEHFLEGSNSDDFYKTLGLQDTSTAVRLTLSQEQRTVLLLMKTLLTDSMISLESKIMKNITPQNSQSKREL